MHSLRDSYILVLCIKLAYVEIAILQYDNFKTLFFVFRYVTIILDRTGALSKVNGANVSGIRTFRVLRALKTLAIIPGRYSCDPAARRWLSLPRYSQLFSFAKTSSAKFNV